MSVKTFSIPVLCFLLLSCGGGRENISNSSVFEPLPDINEPLDQIAINTFPESSLTVSPEIIELPTTDQNKPVVKTFRVAYGTAEIDGSPIAELNLTVRFIDSTGQFRLINEDGKTSTLLDKQIVQNSTLDVAYKYIASRTGIHKAYLEITANRLEGMIRLPVSGQTAGSKNFRIISTNYLCGDKTAPRLTAIDFLRVAEGKPKTESFKICNTSDSLLKIDNILIKPSSGNKISAAFDGTGMENDLFEIDEILNPSLFTYYPIEEKTVKQFAAPVKTDMANMYDARSAFTIKAQVNGKLVTPKNIVINTDKDTDPFVVFDVIYSPNTAEEAPENRLFNPLAQNAGVSIMTNEGISFIDLVAATGAREPILKIVRVPDDSEADKELCASGSAVDIDSAGASLSFDNVDLYQDWAHENYTTEKILLCNTGSGSKPLEVWIDPINDGFFNLHDPQGDLSFPLTVTPEAPRLITLKYSPTPSGDDLSRSFFDWDIGRITFRHTGGNGLSNRMTLTGQQNEKPVSIIDITQNGIPLRNSDHPLAYDTSLKKRKKLPCLKANGTTEIPFVISNHSRSEVLATTITVSGLQKIDERRSRDLRRSTLSINGGNQSSLSTSPSGENTFEIAFNLENDISDGDTVTGLITITNHFSEQAERLFGLSPADYTVYFKAFVSETGECGAGAGEPPDGLATIIIDRITMNLPGGLQDPARNPPSFKFHLPVDLYKDFKRARVHGLPYDPSKPPPPPEQQIRSYAHQITNVAGCYPLPTNPYKLEFKEGSWNGESTRQCAFESADKTVSAKGNAICIADNGAQKIVDPETNQDVLVFYHEFVKFGENCAVEMEGKISTFVLKIKEIIQHDDGTSEVIYETIGDVFKRMDDELKGKGTEAEYAQFTRPYQFDSYINFIKPIDIPGCQHAGMVTDADAIKQCWKALSGQPLDFVSRKAGFMEECSYFQFEIEKGCIPHNAPEVLAGLVKNENVCPPAESDYADPESWKGYGEYEPDFENPDTKYHFTLRNIHIRAFSIAHAIHSLFKHNGRLLYSDLYVTLTTKAVGREYTSNDNDNDDEWDSLVAAGSKSDFDITRVQMQIDENARDFWVEDGANGHFTVGEDDANECDPANNPSNCRGNFEYYNSSLIHAGEAVNLEENNRMMLVGLSAFHGKGQMAPEFAREESNGQGRALYFTFHACIIDDTPVDDDGNPLPLCAEGADCNMGCYEPHWDTTENPNRQPPITDDYVTAGLLTREDLEEGNKETSPAFINYRIMDDDRNRLTNYFAYPNHFKFDNKSGVTQTCGYGN